MLLLPRSAVYSVLQLLERHTKPLLLLPPGAAPSPPACVRRELWQCLCVECCKRASWSPHLAPKSFDEKKNISEPQPALVIKAPLFKSALESQIVGPFKQFVFGITTCFDRKKTQRSERISVYYCCEYFLFSDLLIIVVCPPPTVTNPGFRTMYYYSTQVNKQICI